MWLLNNEGNLLVDLNKAFAIETLKGKDVKRFYVAAYFEVIESGQYNQSAPKQIILKAFETEKQSQEYLVYLHTHLKVSKSA